MTTNLYEAMFVVDAAKGGSQFADSIRHVVGYLTRNGAQIERIEKWDERKLAYPIKQVKRGIYILIYFTAEGTAISEMRSAIALSEEVLRVLIVRAEQQNPPRGELYSPEGELQEPEPEPEAEEAAPEGEEAPPPAAEPEAAPAAPDTEEPPAAAEPEAKQAAPEAAEEPPTQDDV